MRMSETRVADEVFMAGVMTTAAFCHQSDPSSAFGTFSPLRRGEGYPMMILARNMVR
jgi:hypothetical protein